LDESLLGPKKKRLDNSGKMNKIRTMVGIKYFVSKGKKFE